MKEKYFGKTHVTFYLFALAGLFWEHWKEILNHSSVIFPLITSVVTYSTYFFFFISSNFVNFFFLCFAYDTEIIFAIWSLMEETIFWGKGVCFMFNWALIYMYVYICTYIKKYIDSMVKLEISNTACGIRPCNGCIKVKCTSCHLQELRYWIRA